jgi:hypothetical protein
MKNIYLSNNDDQKGPFEIADLKSQSINSDTMVWFEGMADWKRAGDIDEFKDYIVSTPPPLHKEAPPPLNTVAEVNNTPNNIINETIIWYYIDNGAGSEGPFSLNELKNKTVEKDTLVWYEGIEGWTRAILVEKLNGFFPITPPVIVKAENKKETVIWYYIDNGAGSEGPYSLDELKNQKINNNTLVWYEGMGDWEKASEISELKSHFASKPLKLEPIKPIEVKKTNTTSNYTSTSKNVVSYYLDYGQGKMGPYRLDEIKYFRLSKRTLAWNENLGSWKNITEVSDLKNLVNTD